ncbi:hypothetical protein JTB14_012604 [Gonioctena quinquepunctata]|nr:hypothetical protein JTB14_012604 [Gonioctena quinquepunctata]
MFHNSLIHALQSQSIPQVQQLTSESNIKTTTQEIIHTPHPSHIISTETIDHTISQPTTVLEEEPHINDIPLDHHQTNTSSQKRSVSEILTPTPEDTDKTFATPSINHKKKYKSEKLQTDHTYRFPESVKKLIDNHSPQYPLNSQQLENFIENSYGCKNLLALANDYINEPQKIITMLEEIRPQLTDKKIKTRCTKLKTKLLKLITPGTIDAESDSSTYDSSTH